MPVSRLVLIALLSVPPIAPLHSQAPPPSLDSLDAFIRHQLARRQVNGLSLAVIQDGRIVFAKGYGVADATTRTPVTPATLFQAGSISKPVAAMGALHLVEAGRLALDENVNSKLTSWKVPDNAFTTSENVTLRRLLSHNAGLTVHGFPGYDVNDTLPTLIQVLNGASPANTSPIRVDTTPGAIGRYSGGGFTVMQQMMIDVTGKPFHRHMQETVLGPIGMTNSSYEQPQPSARAARTAGGYYSDRTPVRGRWHVYPEMAAAGLWTTATDLAKFAIEIQETLAGRGHGVISPAMARQYLTEQKDGFGLGVAVQGNGPSLFFSHGGRDEGFDAFLFAGAETTVGIAIMINANDNSRLTNRLMGYVARSFHWGEGPWGTGPPAVVRPEPIDPVRLAQYAGYYELAENRMIILVPNPDGSGLSTLADGLPDDDYLAMDSTSFGSNEGGNRLVFTTDPDRAVTGLIWRAGGPRERPVSRVAALPSSRAPLADPDPSLALRIVTALQAIQQGGPMLANASDIPEGTRTVFRDGLGGQLDGVDAMTYLGDEDVTGRRIHRHGSDLARVRLYRLPPKDGARYLLVHLTAEGRVADLDTAVR